VSTGGRAPGYARRLRDELGQAIGAEYGTLVDLIGAVRAELRAERPAPGTPGTAGDFDQWAARWRDALEHDLIGLVRAGRTGEARTLLRAALADDDHKEAVA
jgi:hypothetical protein